MRWDLSVLVESDDPERIKGRLDAFVDDSSRFAERYRGHILDLSPEGLKEMLEAKDDLSLRYENVVTYCCLRFAADQNDPVAVSLNDASSRVGTQVGRNLAFVGIDLGRLLLSRPELVDDPTLTDYRHYLERYLRSAPHYLSEKEEQLVMTKDRSGIRAWSKLQSKWLSGKVFRPVIDGKEMALTMGEVTPYIYSPDREVRKAIYSALGNTLGEDQLLWADALRAIWTDHQDMCRLRGYPSTLTPSLIDNDVEESTIMTLMRVVRSNASLCQRYFEVKASLLGVERLGNWDLRAPLPYASDEVRSWEEAKELLVTVYSDFDPQFGRWVQEMFDLRRMDGELRKGKRTGAFCDTWVNGRSAFILSSYNGHLNDVYTLAHELGHGVHAYLYTRAQNPSNCQISLCVAECGSMFGELLLTERLLEQVRTVEERKELLVKVLNSFTQVVFQEGFRFLFEMDLAKAVDEGRFLDGAAISDMWTDSQRVIYGSSIEYLPENRWDWARFPHHYFSDIRFYDYPYVFAQLFVYALYRLYKEQGKGFVPRLNALLSAGSSRSATELARELGFDIDDEEFWQKGIDQAGEFLRQLEELG